MQIQQQFKTNHKFAITIFMESKVKTSARLSGGMSIVSLHRGSRNSDFFDSVSLSPGTPGSSTRAYYSSRMRVSHVEQLVLVKGPRRRLGKASEEKVFFAALPQATAAQLFGLILLLLNESLYNKPVNHKWCQFLYIIQYK